MADIHIERLHHLGRNEARQLAERWSQEAAKKFDLAFTVDRSDSADTLAFSRGGVDGTLRVDADRYTFDARLGLLLTAFKPQIEAEVERNFDRMLQKPGGRITGGN